MKTLITVIIGIALGISLQLATAHTPCDDRIQPRPVKICGFETHFDNNGNAQQVWVCNEY